MFTVSLDRSTKVPRPLVLAPDLETPGARSIYRKPACARGCYLDPAVQATISTKTPREMATARQLDNNRRVDILLTGDGK